MKIRSKFQEIKSIYKLDTYEVDILNKIIEYFSKEIFHNSKPKFKFQLLLVGEHFHHFFCNISGINIKVLVKNDNVLEFMRKRFDGMKETYFNLSVNVNYMGSSYDGDYFWDMFGTIEFDEKQFVADQKKIYGNVGYYFLKMSQLVNKYNR